METSNINFIFVSLLYYQIFSFYLNLNILRGHQNSRLTHIWLPKLKRKFTNFCKRTICQWQYILFLSLKNTGGNQTCTKLCIHYRSQTWTHKIKGHNYIKIHSLQMSQPRIKVVLFGNVNINHKMIIMIITETLFKKCNFKSINSRHLFGVADKNINLPQPRSHLAWSYNGRELLAVHRNNPD